MLHELLKEDNLTKITHYCDQVQQFKMKKRDNFDDLGNPALVLWRVSYLMRHLEAMETSDQARTEKRIALDFLAFHLITHQKINPQSCLYFGKTAQSLFKKAKKEQLRKGNTQEQSFAYELSDSLFISEHKGMIYTASAGLGFSFLFLSSLVLAPVMPIIGTMAIAVILFALPVLATHIALSVSTQVTSRALEKVAKIHVNTAGKPLISAPYPQKNTRALKRALENEYIKPRTPDEKADKTRLKLGFFDEKLIQTNPVFPDIQTSNKVGN
ncbi:MAG: hypothetical protein WC785_09575 [Tatlockia sp.]